MSQSDLYDEKRFMSVVRKMIDLLDKIIEYITYDIWINKNEYNEVGEKDLKRIIYWIKKYDITFKLGIDDYDLEKFEKNIEKLKEIRTMYHQGLPFVKNKTKDHKKGDRNAVFMILGNMIKRGDLHDAKERAEKHLRYIKEWKSERTYYRHKKRIRELGLEI